MNENRPLTLDEMNCLQDYPNYRDLYLSGNIDGGNVFLTCVEILRNEAENELIIRLGTEGEICQVVFLISTTERTILDVIFGNYSLIGTYNSFSHDKGYIDGTKELTPNQFYEYRNCSTVILNIPRTTYEVNNFYIRLQMTEDISKSLSVEFVNGSIMNTKNPAELKHGALYLVHVFNTYISFVTIEEFA